MAEWEVRKQVGEKVSSVGTLKPCRESAELLARAFAQAHFQLFFDENQGWKIEEVTNDAEEIVAYQFQTPCRDVVRYSIEEFVSF